MASFLDKFKVQTAVEENTKLDLSCQTITTADFMQLTPVYMKEMVPGEKLVVSQQTFTRMAPMPVPTFGRANVHNRGFFVPYRTIYKGWNDFITDTPHVDSNKNQSNIAQSVPIITMDDLAGALFTSDSNAVGSTGVGGRFGFLKIVANTAISDRAEDLSVVDADLGINYVPTDNSETPSDWDASAIVGNILTLKLNKKGRQIYKILRQLGYQFSPIAGGRNIQMSALPLFAFFKVYIDWYYPAAYFGDVTRSLIEGILNYDNNSADNRVSSQQLITLFDLMSYVNYDSDYFVSAFDKPEGPNLDQASRFIISDITNSGTNNGDTDTSGVAWARKIDSSNVDRIQSKANTPLLIGQAASGNLQTIGPLNSVSQYALNALQKLTDYMKRHQLVGARAMDRYLARFGKQLSAEKLNRSLYLNHQSFPLQFGDVMSQSDTTGAQLGDYAGKGLGFGEGRYEYDTDEYGLFLICNSIVPTIGYYQGVDRTVMHLSKTDFWTPEFDQLGNQAISRAELYMAQNPRAAINPNQAYWNSIFGYTPRYSEYKIGRDRLTGDFAVPTLNQSGDTSSAWHFMRQFKLSDFVGSGTTPSSTNVIHSKEFVQGLDSSQYNRIFYNTEDTADHFYVIHNFDVVSWSPMHALYDTYEFDEDGKKVVADVNGVKVN